MNSFWSLLAWGWLGAAIVMQLLWLVQLRTRNAGIVDVGWAAILGSLGVFYAVVGSGAPPHRLLLALTAGFWGWRLALHLLFDRVKGEPEEGRYVELRANWGAQADAKFVLFFQAQAFLAALLSVPFALVALRTEASLSGWGLLGAALWLVGISLESLADRQLARFKANPENRGQVCDRGLWRYSRHPNYFFEWVIWLGFAAMAWGTPQGWLGVASPALILLFVLKITGIPPTEAQAIRSRGDLYREYQRRTSAFVPWFPRRKAG